MQVEAILQSCSTLSFMVGLGLGTGAWHGIAMVEHTLAS
jgi:hypothetical protein